LALIGGATGMIGDPSGKSQERNLLDEATLRHNVECIRQQLARFLDFDSDAPNHAELVNNYDWMKDFTFLDFAREVGKHITVNYMMAKDSVQKRLNGEARDGLSFTEFTYQLLQGYDFLYLYQHKGCKLQMGGSDQWGNITTGSELVRRTVGGEVFALTCPLVTKADGTKFGKTEKGKQIVFKSGSGIEQYEVIKVGKSGKAESWVRYTYFNDAEEFEIAKKGSKSGNFKIVDSDKDLRVIVYENKNKKLFEGTDFDTMLKNVRDFGYTVVE
jgi:tyrosyl-tRNA synthetase